jgi:predicted ABC-type transport system involved in lysophospholipase L1 biosynthesis ATPase subunit
MMPTGPQLWLIGWVCLIIWRAIPNTCRVASNSVLRLGNLDEATGDAVLDLMLALVADTGAAFLMVTHSTRLAARLSGRLHLAHGQIAAP